MEKNGNKSILDFDEDMELDIRVLINAVFKKKYWIICAAVIGLVLGIGYAKFRKTPTYHVNFTIYVDAENFTEEKGIDSSAEIMLKVNTAAELLKSGDVLQDVIDQTGTDTKVSTVVKNANVKTVLKGQTQILEVTVSFPDEKTTAAFADELAATAPAKIEELLHGTAVKVITAPDGVVTTPVSLRSYGIKGFMAGFALALFVVLARALFDHCYPKK